MMAFLFVGEKPSPTAYRNGWTWTTARLAAKPLWEALTVMGVDPQQCGFVNLFGDRPGTKPVASTDRIAVLRAIQCTGAIEIIALGNRVARELSQHGIVHRKLRHPAARGSGRKTAHYRALVAATLGKTTS